MRRRALVVLSLALVTLWIGGAASAAPPYPAVLPDFGSTAAAPFNGDPMYSPIGGDDDRDLVVVLVNFSDATIPAGRDAAFYSAQIFGTGFGTLRDYFNDNSFGDFQITPAQETDASNNGAANDGIITVTLGQTLAQFNALTDGGRDRAVVDAADPFFNYAAYDPNNDGDVRDDELIFLWMRAPGPNNDACGATRGVDPGTNDGKNVVMSIAIGTTATELITHIHEIGHSALHMRDMYGFGPGSLDITAPTCGYNDTTFFGVNAWQKLNWGWIAPTVVVQDGYYTINQAHTNQQAYILYDPSKGADDYFIVENRQRTNGTYDQNIQDSGLVIWRIDETQYNSNDNNIRPMEIMRADGATAPGPVQCNASDPPPGSCFSAGANGDAWNPADPAFPQRTMIRTWRDGTASNLAVRAIGRSGSTMRAYFDVRGAGVLVDPTVQNSSDPNYANPMTVNVTPEEANTVSFPVMNTGEATDTFNFTVGGLPAGWTATTHTMTLNAGQGAVANVTVTPEANAATGIYNVTAVGTSTTDSTVTTSCGFTLNVVLDQTTLTYTGDTSQPWGEGAGWAARVNNPDDAGNPVVPNVPVTFTISNGTDTQSASGTSDASGIASANPTLTVPPGTYTLTMSSPRVGKHAPATATTTYTVERRPTTLVYGGDLTADYSDPAAVNATLTDAISGAPLGSKTVSFAIGTQNTSASTDAAGLAASSITLSQAAGNYAVDSSFAGDTFYLPSSDSDAFVITKETLSFVYTGDTLVALGTTPNLASQATEESDGSPGDLSLAEAKFTLSPTLTLTPFDYTTGVNSSGVSTTPATGLPVDLWTVTIDVPSTNNYWAGTSSSAAELVLFDPNAKITGKGSGRDSSNRNVSINFNGFYENLTPVGSTKLDSSAGSFNGKVFDWIVQVGNQAIFQIQGEHTGMVPAVLRVRFLDGGEPSIPDTFRAVERNSLLGTTIYDSGVVTVRNGNLQTHQ